MSNLKKKTVAWHFEPSHLSSCNGVEVSPHLCSHCATRKAHHLKGGNQGNNDLLRGFNPDWKIRLMEEILHHLGCIKPCIQITVAGFLPSTVLVDLFFSTATAAAAIPRLRWHGLVPLHVPLLASLRHDITAGCVHPGTHRGGCTLQLRILLLLWWRQFRLLVMTIDTWNLRCTFTKFGGGFHWTRVAPIGTGAGKCSMKRPWKEHSNH